MKLKAIICSLLFVFLISPILYYNSLSTRSLVVKNIFYITNKEGNSGGTGFLLNYKGRQVIITNRHVCKGIMKDNKVVVKSDDKTMWEAEVEEISTKYDLCKVKVPQQLKAWGLYLANKAPVAGEKVYIFGHPLLLPLAESKGEFLEEKIAGVMSDLPPAQCVGPNFELVQILFWQLCIEKMLAMHTNIMIQPGNSGSPVTDKHGGVIGVAFASYSDLSWASVVPVRFLQEFLDSGGAKDGQKSTNM